MLFDEIKIFMRHGKQYIPDITKVELAPLFRGRPEISADITPEETETAQKLCPTGAIGSNPASIDLAKCVFCKECHFLYPEKIKFTNDYKIATNDPVRLVIKAGETAPVTIDETMIRPEIKSLFGGALKFRQVSAAGDNACEMELNACGNVNFDMGRWGIEFTASPRHADGLVITGPISENMAEALDICYHSTPAPKLVILVGSDALSGGIFEGSPALKRNFLKKYPIDLYVPGNPAHPLTFINGILELTRGKNFRKG